MADLRVTYSVIVPCYNESECVRAAYERLSRVMRETGESYELIFVNDGSRDDTGAQLSALAAADPAVRAVHLARNRGHQIAVTAGLDRARGDAVIIIDADMQDPPEVIPELIDAWRAGGQVVYGRRRSHKGISRFKRVTAHVFYRLINRLTDGCVPMDAGDFRLIDRRVADAVRAMPEHNRFLRGMFAWVGFAQTAVDYDRDARLAGHTHYSLKKMLSLATDGLLGFSDAPVQFIGLTGAVLCALSVLALLGAAVAALAGAQAALFALAAFMALLAGLVLLSLFVVGLYVCRVYDEARGRPLYIVAREEGGPVAPPPLT